MDDPGFHLTPVDIRKQEFRKAVRGYDAAGVEGFRERVADELERVIRDRAQLEERVRNFQDQLRAFRERERAMNEALVSAQQLRDDTKDAAEREAKLVVREAQGQAADILAEARRVETDIRERTKSIERQFQSYLAGFRALLERQLSELDALEHQNAAQQPAGEPEE